MAIKIVRILVLTTLLFSVSKAQSVFVNEFHYDNASTDQDEGIEIAGPAGTDLSCYKILLYNGANGRVSNTMTLFGTIPDACNGFGMVWFPASLQNGGSGIGNGSDGFALVLDSSLCGGGTSLSILQFLSYEGSFTAVDGDAIGLTSDSLPVAESNSTPVGNSAQLTGNGTVFTDFTWTTDVSSHDAVNIGQTFGGPCGAIIATQLLFSAMPTGCILTNQVFALSICATNGSGVTDTGYSGTVNLSLASGSGNLNGTLSATFSSGCTTLSGLSVDALDTYTFSASDGSLSGSSPNMYISSSCTRCPNLTGSVIDACGTSEGRNEIIFFNSGDYSIPLRYPDFNLTYGANNPPTTTYSNGFTSNIAYVDSLNAFAGCSIFVDAYTNGVIPPQTAFMLMRSNPDYTYDFSPWCGQAPVWVVFTTDVNWVEIGNFKNCIDCATNGSDPRYFRANFSNLTGGAPCDFQYEYTPCSTLVCPGGGTGNSSGDGHSWPYGGGVADSAWNECTPSTPTILPVYFQAPLTASLVGDQVRLNWATEHELNSSHFVVERRAGYQDHFEEIGRQPAMGRSTTVTPYSFIDYFPPSDKSIFYRLRQFDQDGTEFQSNIAEVRSDLIAGENWEVLVDGDGQFIEFNIEGEGESEVSLFNLNGQLMARRHLRSLGGSMTERVETSGLASGLYLYDIRIGSVRHSGKVLLQR